MDHFGGRLNPVVRATKMTRYHKVYTEEQNSNIANMPNVECAKHKNPNRISSIGPMNPTGNNEEPVPLGRDPGDQSYGIIPGHKFQSGVIMVDPDLKLLAALQKDRNLLASTGLEFDPTDDVYIMKDPSGMIKGAIAISYSNMGQITTVNYMDVADDSANFTKSIEKFIAQGAGSSLMYAEGAQVIRNDIRKDLLIEEK